MNLDADGHARAYFGTRQVQKMHVARLKFPGPATEETWVTDAGGDPVFMVIAEPSQSLAGQLRGLLPQLRGRLGVDVGERRREGLAEVATREEISITGGDLVSSPVLLVSVTAIGYEPGRARFVTRAGAGPRDVVAVTGEP